MEELNNETCHVVQKGKGGQIIITVEKLEEMCEILELEKKAKTVKKGFYMHFDQIIIH